MTDRDTACRALEAILLSADQPVPSGLLADLVDVTVPEVDQLCQEISAGYEVDGRGFILARVAGGWRFQTHPDLAPYVERFVLEGQSARLSAAALETLAIVAYKQPISRAQVAAIRGVNVDAVMRTLEQRGYVVEVGRDPGPGQAVLFGTSTLLLEKLGLDSLDQLPSLSEFVPGPDIVEALEHGLRPEPTDDATPVAKRPSSAAPGSAPVPVREAAGDADAGTGAPDAGDGDDEHELGDPLSRLDETAARLDALVDQVRDRLAAAEAAVAEREASDAAETQATDDDGSEPGAGGTDEFVEGARAEGNMADEAGSGEVRDADEPGAPVLAE